MKLQQDKFWQKYRPSTFDDAILPQRIKTIITKEIGINNLLLYGTVK